MSRDLILLAISLFAWGIGEGMFFYFQPLYLQELGANPLAIGGILGAMGVAMTVAHIPAGYLADRIGRRPLLWAAWIMGLLAAWGMALAPNLPFFVGGLLLYGMTAFVSSPMNSYVTAARGDWSVGRALTLLSASYNLGAIAGPILGGMVGDLSGLRMIYRIAAGIFVVSTALILFIRPQPVEHHLSGAPQKLALTRPYLIYLAIIFLAMLAMYLPQPLSSNFLRQVQGLDFSAVGKLGSLASAGVVVLGLALGRLSARKGFLLAHLGALFFALFLWRGNGMLAFGAGYFLMGGYRVARSLATAQTRDLVEAGNMGLAYGITETVNGATVVLAPLLAGWLYSRDPVLMYPFSALLMGISLLVAWKFMPRKTEE